MAAKNKLTEIPNKAVFAGEAPKMLEILCNCVKNDLLSEQDKKYVRALENATFTNLHIDEATLLFEQLGADVFATSPDKLNHYKPLACTTRQYPEFTAARLIARLPMLLNICISAANSGLLTIAQSEYVASCAENAKKLAEELS